MNRRVRTLLVVLVVVLVAIGIAFAVGSGSGGSGKPHATATTRARSSSSTPNTTVPAPRPAPPAATGYFALLPPGSQFPSDATCAARVHKSAWEPVPANRLANHRTAVSYTHLTLPTILRV